MSVENEEEEVSTAGRDAITVAFEKVTGAARHIRWCQKAEKNF